MKKAAVIALILLLLVSLGTSVILQFVNIPKIKADLQNAQESDKKKVTTLRKLQEEFKTTEGSIIDAKNKLTAAEKKGDYSRKQYEAEKDRAKKQYEELKIKLDDSNKNQSALMEQITFLSSTNESVVSELSKRSKENKAIAEKLKHADRMVAEQSGKLDAIQKKLEGYEKLGHTPGKLVELLKRQPVIIKTPEISRPKPLPPGKLKAPLPVSGSNGSGKAGRNIQPK
jgi:chromosome segregation ATPase